MAVIESVKNWVRIDNEIKGLNDKIKELRDERRTSEVALRSWADPLMAQGKKATINISDGKLRFVETKQVSPLTLKYVEERLIACLGEAQRAAVEQIMNDIKENREYKLVQEVKRVYNK